jgi:diaminohydroxyphosphoribosylaminopyrimidine deaminase/5-amino-6-(5-phosphoribosylamino)uracil reductase
MRRALELARQAAGGVSPRPPVGAVVVKDGRAAGEGATEPRPGRHAEAVALQAAGAAARGATMYVSLEPHAHQGVAPPCTDAIIAAGIVKVVCPIEDPNPQVSGNGFRQLRAAGVEVVAGGPDEDRRQAAELVEGFAHWVATRRPLIIAKFAMSLDGKIATRSGDSKWITSEESRRVAHEMRRTADAVIAGIGTVLRDDPRLTARDVARSPALREPFDRLRATPQGPGRPASRPRLRVIVDTDGRMPSSAALLREPGRVLWVRGGAAGRSPLPSGGPSTSSGQPVQGEGIQAMVEAIDLPRHPDGVDLDALVRLLGEREACTVMVEGGGTLLGSMFDRGLVNKVAAFVAPVVIGGKAAPGPVGGAGVEKMAQALRLERVRFTQVGEDMLVTGYVKP